MTPSRCLKTFRNIQRYSLFGDPATRLAMPRFQVQIDVADSLRALGEVAHRRPSP